MRSLKDKTSRVLPSWYNDVIIDGQLFDIDKRDLFRQDRVSFILLN